MVWHIVYHYTKTKYLYIGITIMYTSCDLSFRFCYHMVGKNLKLLNVIKTEKR